MKMNTKINAGLLLGVAIFGFSESVVRANGLIAGACLALAIVAVLALTEPTDED